ncbi:hypothetical protein PIB30_080632 [Stylosanthes scabra]|uniref:Uncharacterized protein n=1 Tax=Stylosanthes scabra TaxID=79078 RepID=A0ABU6VRB3_9FABA|nr:hypothetical protein [Stylosanthes scabra]
MGQVNWLLTDGLGLIGPVRNITPTREVDVNVSIQFPSSSEFWGDSDCFLRIVPTQPSSDCLRRNSLGLFFAKSSPLTCLFIIRRTRKMRKKKSCQNVKVPRPLNAVEQKLDGWVEQAIFTQPSVVLGDSLPELRRTMRLTEGAAAEGDFVLEAAGPSDRLPFRAGEDGPHFLWVYQELFTRLGVRLPFTDFQREVITRCRVAANQLHLNG